MKKLEYYDSEGNILNEGDIIRVFHFIGARRKRKHFMYKQVGKIEHYEGTDNIKRTRLKLYHLPLGEGFYHVRDNLKEAILVQSHSKIWRDKDFKRSKSLTD